MVAAELGKKIGKILDSPVMESDSTLGHSSRISSSDLKIRVTDITPGYQMMDLSRIDQEGNVEDRSFAVIDVVDSEDQINVDGVIIGTGVGKTIEIFDKHVFISENPVLTQKYAK